MIKIIGCTFLGIFLWIVLGFINVILRNIYWKINPFDWEEGGEGKEIIFIIFAPLAFVIVSLFWIFKITCGFLNLAKISFHYINHKLKVLFDWLQYKFSTRRYIHPMDAISNNIQETLEDPICNDALMGLGTGIQVRTHSGEELEIHPYDNHRTAEEVRRYNQAIRDLQERMEETFQGMSLLCKHGEGTCPHNHIYDCFGCIKYRNAIEKEKPKEPEVEITPIRKLIIED